MSHKSILHACLAAFAALLMATPALAAVEVAAPGPALPERIDGVPDAWQTDTVRLAVAAHADKVPTEFWDRFEFLLDDGRLRVIINAEAPGAIDDVLGTAPVSRMDEDGIALVTPDQLVGLLAHPQIRFVEPDYPVVWNLAVSVPDINGRGAGAPWSLSHNAFPGSLETGAWDEAYTGKGVTVAVVDSGIDGTHRDFGGFDCTDWDPYQPCDSRIKGHIKISGQLVDLGVYPEMDVPAEYTNEAASGHGTHVAGTIAGNGYRARESSDPARYGNDGIPVGVAPEAELFDISNGDTLWAGLGSGALWWLTNHHEEYDIKVASNSWGCLGGCEYNAGSATSQYIRTLFEAGVVVVFAAGNDGNGAGSGDSLSGNAESPYAIGVANYDHADHQIAQGSSRGKAGAALPDPATWTPESEGADPHDRPDVAAPGTGIWSARTLTGGAASLAPRADVGDALGGGAGGTVPYAVMGGTSMAAPHVSGAAAVLFDACPDATSLDVYRAIFAGADPDRLTHTGGAAFTQSDRAQTQGYGALDVTASLQWIFANTSCGGGVSPLSVSLDGATVTEGDEVGLSADISGGDGSTVSWDWDLTPPAGSSATLSDAAAAAPSFTADVPGDYAVTVQATMGSETASDSATVTAEAEVVKPPAETTLYLGSTGPTFVGTVDQLVFFQPLSEQEPGDLGYSQAADPNNGWSTAASPIGIGGPNWLVDLVWESDGSYTLADQEVTATLWVSSALGAAIGSDHPVQVTLWADDGAYRPLATVELTHGTTVVNGATEVTGSFGVIEEATGTLAISVHTPFFDANGGTRVLYDDIDQASRIEILEAVVANTPPSADAGADQSVDEETDASLDGSASSDAEGPIASYAWTQTAGPAVTLDGADTATPSFEAPAVDADTTLTFALTVTDADGASDTDSVDVTVTDTTTYASHVTILDPQDGATIDEPAAGLNVSGDWDPRVPVETTQSVALPIGWQDPGQGGNGDYVYIDSPGDGAAVDGVTSLAGRAGNSPTDPDDDGECTEDCGEPFDFGAPQSTDLRPGDLSSVCTLNFVYEHLDPATKQYRYFFGSAAHCAANGSSTQTNGCVVEPEPIGSTERLSTGTGTTITATLAYSSWATMQANNEGDSNTCFGNDFALFEIDAKDLDKVHPAVRMYGGPTGLGQIADMVPQDELRGYGRSMLHDDTVVNDPEESLTNPKNGYFLRPENGGWSYFVYLLPQGVPGDSGGGIMDIDGNALGAASTISGGGWDLSDPNDPKVTPPGSNNYANIARALEYMEAKEGWAPDLVTWDAFDPDPRVSLVTGSDEGPTASAQAPAGFLGLLSDLASMLGATPSSEAPDDGIVPGTLGEVEGVQVSDDGKAVTLELFLGDADDLFPTVLGNPVSYEASFTTDHNGPITYRVDYRNEAVATAGNVPTGEVMKQTFEMQVVSAESNNLRSFCPIEADLSGSDTHFDEDASTYSIRWVVPFKALVADTEPAQGACDQVTTGGAPLAAGDTLADIRGKAVAKAGTVTLGNFQDESDEPQGHTVGGCTADCGPAVAFTVNGADAGSAPVTDGAWTHAIDFATFTADADGRYTVVATHGTATEAAVYAGPDADPCADFADQVVVTIGHHTACTPYDPSTAGPWATAFGDLSDLAAGEYALTATAYDSAGAPLDDHTITVQVGTPDSDGDGVEDDADNCPATANPDQADLDGDGIGDACDSDRDGDGVDNDDDDFPDDGSEWADSDGDGVGDNSDACAGFDDGYDHDSDGTPDGCDSDADDKDGDGIDSHVDNCPGHANPGQEDMDGDGKGDVCDEDRDGDGHSNGKEEARGSDPDDSDSVPGSP